MTDNRTTELLRKLLDERDVEWRETINHANCIFTWWESPTFGTVYAMDNEDGETLFMDCLNNCDLTPEQAIAATLGEKRTCETCDELGNADSFINHLIQAERAERTCEMRADGAHCMNGVEFYECCSCGEYACIPTVMGKSEPPNWCPNCGAKVIDTKTANR